MVIKNKVVLITGGTGSFGRAVLKKFLDSGASKVIVFSRDEKKQYDMRNEFKNDPRIYFFIGDVRDYSSILSAMKGVDYVFHAAALKQVPSGEFFPMEVVKTNILGTENVLNAAIQSNVKKVVCLSTDKAVYPINAMGISKAMMEKVFRSKSQLLNPGDTIICGTRYGNVIGSRGSVIPLFIDQIRKGQPMTITNPDMTRFMMSLEEAVELVLYALDNGQQGDLFIMKSPAAKISDIALAVAKGMNKKTNSSIIGTRQGEKMYETLMSFEESLVAEDLRGFYRIPSEKEVLDYESYFSKGIKSDVFTQGYNSNETTQMSVDQIASKLNEIGIFSEE
jgi:UDP-N-acetylglucosamine 4,6-dehydratase/5-epimerase